MIAADVRPASASASNTGPANPLACIAEQLLAARAEFGRDALRRVEHGFLHYARLRPPLVSAHPLQAPTWLLPGVADHGPWPAPVDLPAIALLEAQADVIIAELRTALAGGAAADFDDGTPHRGRWQALHLRYGAEPQPEGRALAPRTAAIVDALPGLGEMAMVSVLGAGCHIEPHCGLHNWRWTAHLGIDVPDDCTFTVGGETRRWYEGRCLLFDDSWRHEARNDGDRDRAVLLVDFWHPDLDPVEVIVLDRIAADLARLRRRP